MNNELDQAAVRTWLKQMPDAGVFNDKCWLACDDNNEEPRMVVTQLHVDKPDYSTLRGHNGYLH